MTAHDDLRHAPDTISVRAILVSLAAILAIIGALLAGLRLAVLPLLERRPVQPAAWTEATPGSAPRLQIAPGRDLRTLEEAQRRQLTSYGWIDRKAGIAHIPIERAMERLAAEGAMLNDRKPVQAEGAGVDRGTRVDRSAGVDRGAGVDQRGTVSPSPTPRAREAAR